MSQNEIVNHLRAIESQPWLEIGFDWSQRLQGQQSRLHRVHRGLQLAPRLGHERQRDRVADDGTGHRDGGFINLPDNFLPLETLYGMTRSVPSLEQLARAKIRSRMVECDKFSRENLQELELTQTMKDFVQLSDLGDGSEVKEIMSHMEEEA